MLEFLKTAFEALPEAAKSPLALVGYLAAIGAWSAIAWRVKRNKQLLTNLDKLPEQDRLKALELEMGSLPLAPGLTADQWLKARIQRYYFLAFGIICVVVVIVFAIASFNARAHDSTAPLKEGISQLDVRLRRDVVISKIGVPYSEVRFRACTCTDYRFEFAYVQVLYDKRDEVMYYLVVAKARDFHPTIPLPYKLDKVACLGCLSFTDIIPKGEAPEPSYFNYSAHLYTYTEGVPYYGRGSQGRSIDISFLGAGQDFGSQIPTSDILDRMTKTETAFKEAPAQARQEFETFRSRTRPNAFAVYTEDLWAGADKLGAPPYLNLPKGGGEADCTGRLADQGF